MKTRAYISGVVLAGLFLALVPFASAAQAATLSFDPTSINVKVGETFKVDMLVDTGTAEALGVDGLFQFDPAVIEAQKIDDGTFLKISHKEIKTDGKVYAVGLVNSPGEAVQGPGTLATVTFKALKNGTTNLTYICELNDTRESNVLGNSTDSPDLLDCSSLGKAVVVVTGGTTTGGGTGGSTTGGGTGGSTLPKTGEFENFGLIVISGGLLVVVGLTARRFI